jgi:hypothetical protein
MARAQRQSVSEACLATSGVRMLATFVLMLAVSTGVGLHGSLRMVVGFTALVILVVRMALVSTAMVEGVSVLSGIAKLP